MLEYHFQRSLLIGQFWRFMMDTCIMNVTCLFCAPSYWSSVESLHHYGCFYKILGIF